MPKIGPGGGGGGGDKKLFEGQNVQVFWTYGPLEIRSQHWLKMSGSEYW